MKYKNSSPQQSKVFILLTPELIETILATSLKWSTKLQNARAAFTDSPKEKSILRFTLSS
jgi:hypothetical protein